MEEQKDNLEKQMRIKLILLLTMKLLVALVCFGFMTMSFPNSAWAQEKEDVRGAKGEISTEDMIKLLKNRKWIEGYEIKGDDIINIIKGTDLDIKIKNSVIEGRLDFDKLEWMPLEDVKLNMVPPDQEQEWKKMKSDLNIKKVRQVNNRISIVDSEIRPLFSISVSAQDVVFKQEIDFSRTIFGGQVYFRGATFSGIIRPWRPPSKPTRKISSDEIAAAWFTDATFTVEAWFDRANFMGVAHFKNAKFRKTASFKNVTFGYGAYFSGARFAEDVRFSNSTMGKYPSLREKISFADTDFAGEVVFDKSMFRFKTADFSGATFHGKVAFRDVQMKEGADFSRAIFHGSAWIKIKGKMEDSAEVSFEQAAFHGRAHFFGSAFAQSTFKNASFHAYVSFSGAKFEQKPSFFSTSFLGRTRFSKAVFKQGANFDLATFSGDAVFNGTVFSQGWANFEKATFKKRAHFRGARIYGGMKVGDETFQGYGDFREALIRTLTIYDKTGPIFINGRLDFRDAKISKVHFEDIIFTGRVDFSHAEFGAMVEGKKKETMESEKLAGKLTPDTAEQQEGSAPGTVFRFVTFLSNASFYGTRFIGETEMHEVSFQGEADFRNAHFEEYEPNSDPSFTFSQVKFRDLRISFDQLPDPAHWRSGNDLELKSHILQRLEANFRSKGQLDDANKAYYHMKLEERNETNEPFGKWIKAWAEWSLWGLTSGYGTKLSRILGWSLLVWLIFAFIYAYSGNAKRRPHPPAESDFSFRLRLLDFPKVYLAGPEAHPSESGADNTQSEKQKVSHNIATAANGGGISPTKFIDTIQIIWNGLRFSFVVLFKVGYRDTTIHGRIFGFDLKYIVVLEWMLGYLLLAALIVTLTNTQPLINKLIAGVF